VSRPKRKGIRLQEPGAMTPEERLAEVAVLLARGFARCCAAAAESASGSAPPEPMREAVKEVSAERAQGARNQLADSLEREPSCSHAVNGREKGVA
jgi:hypothetical protein